MLSFLAREDIRIEWKVRNCSVRRCFDDSLWRTREGKGPASDEHSWLGEHISGTLCQAVYPASAQRQQVEMGTSEPRGKGPHLERIYQLFCKAFWWSCQYFCYRHGGNQLSSGWLCRFYSSRAGGQGVNPGEDPGRRTKMKWVCSTAGNGGNVLGRWECIVFRQKSA